MLFDRTQDQSVEVLEVERNSCRTRVSTCSALTPSFRQPYKTLARILILSKLLRYTRTLFLTAVQHYQHRYLFSGCCLQENILTIARQQAKIDRLDQEIEEAKTSSHQLEPISTGKAAVSPAGQASAIHHNPPQLIQTAGLQRDDFDQHHVSTRATRGNSPQSQATSLSRDSLNCSSLSDVVMRDASEAAASQHSVWL